MKKILIGILGVGIIIVLIAAGCQKEQPIGGETDEHGCYLMAGYAWCETKQKCLREWEEPCELVGESCGTVTPGYRDECCARQNKDAPHILCVGSWKYNSEQNLCEFVCEAG